MKNKTKYLMPLLVISTFVAGCSTYRSDASEKSEIVGTYKLTTITKNRNQHEDPYDYKAENEIEAYFTVGLDGFSYYAYKDKNTSWWMKQTYVIFNEDFDEKGLYDSINITDGKTHVSVGESEVGCMDEPKLGFQNNKSNGLFSKAKAPTLSYTIPYEDYDGTIIHNHQEYQYVSYEKISSTTSLEYLNSVLNASFSFEKPTIVSNLGRFYTYKEQNIVEGEYVTSHSNDTYEYMIVDFNTYQNGNVSLYYSLKSEPGMKTGTATLKHTPENGNQGKLVLKIFDKEYIMTNWLLYNFTFSGEGAQTDGNIILPRDFDNYNGEAQTIEDVIADITK